jgi:hypothetical protein
MCGKKWSEIDPQRVPGKCLLKNRKAFFNEKLKSNSREFRYNDDEDRIKCHQNFKEYFDKAKRGEVKVNGSKTVMPHELVQNLIGYLCDGDEIEHNEIVEAQWKAIHDEFSKDGDGLKRCIPMCDFSGSMNGIPKLISLALGILISEINNSNFKDYILTFDSKPKWYSFAECDSLREKLNIVHKGLGVGLSTDFYKACMCILDRMKSERVPVGEEPLDLIVLTDMGFDDACNRENFIYNSKTRTYENSGWPSQIEKIRREFFQAGEELWGEGKGWKAPRIVIWNLRAEYNDFHATADQEGVIMISGWSPNILNVLKKDGATMCTPYMCLRAILDDKRYDPIREIWDRIHLNTT